MNDRTHPAHGFTHYRDPQHPGALFRVTVRWRELGKTPMVVGVRGEGTRNILEMTRPADAVIFVTPARELVEDDDRYDVTRNGSTN